MKFKNPQVVCVRKSNLLILLFCIVCSQNIYGSPEPNLPEQLRVLLKSDKVAGLYLRTYNSLVDRIQEDGYFEDSFTGTYSGMYTRTEGGLVPLLIETGEYAKAELVLKFIVEGMHRQRMERIPHILGPVTKTGKNVSNKDSILIALEAGTPLYKIGDGYSGAVEFIANEFPIKAIEVKIAKSLDLLSLTSSPLFFLEICSDINSPAQYRFKYDPNVCAVIPGWKRFAFPKPIQLENGQKYYFRFANEGPTALIWYGDEVTDSNNPGYAKNPQMSWQKRPNHIPSLAIDTGFLTCGGVAESQWVGDDCQIDTQAEVIDAWAKLANKRGPTEFEKATYETFAELMDRTVDRVYFSYGDTWSTQVNLVRNMSCEHSREGRRWDTWDVLTQVFVGSALNEMLVIGKRHGDEVRVKRWTERLKWLKYGIDKNLTRVVDNKKVYLEMRLPNGAGGIPFTGMGWLNLSVLAAQWDPLDSEVIQNTVNLIRSKLLLDDPAASGNKYLAAEFDPDGTVQPWVIGKVIGWEIEYARQHHEYTRIIEILQFLARNHDSEPIFMEAMGYDSQKKKWVIRDAGNGEMCVWYCWGMARLYKEMGLPAVPVNQR